MLGSNPGIPGGWPMGDPIGRVSSDTAAIWSEAHDKLGLSEVSSFTKD